VGGLPQGHRAEFGGGGLVRSAGGWAAVRALRRQKDPPLGDPRILGSRAFVTQLLHEAEDRTRHTLRVTRPGLDLARLARRVAARAGLPPADLQSGRRTQQVSQARRLLCQLAVRHLGFPGAAVARFLGVTTSAVNRTAWSEPVPGVEELT